MLPTASSRNSRRKSLFASCSLIVSLKLRVSGIYSPSFLRFLYSAQSICASSISACSRFFVPPPSRITSCSPSLPKYTLIPRFGPKSSCSSETPDPTLLAAEKKGIFRPILFGPLGVEQQSKATGPFGPSREYRSARRRPHAANRILGHCRLSCDWERLDRRPCT